jgi:16S rRNA (adenine1518-N6/adenine1519-N6)-dimethyltransferase
MRPIKAKPSYGQHFLKDKRLALKIVAACEPNLTDNFIEIGPGKGVLTNLLVQKSGFVLAFELDKRLGMSLRETYRKQDNIAIMIGDFLDFNPGDLESNVKIIGNIPYNITTPILEKLLEFGDKIDQAVLTMQKEVADKLTAVPGTSDYGKLTIQVWSGFETMQLFSIPRKAFSPPPKVASRVVRLIPLNRGIDSPAEFSRFISGCFSQKNRTLQNCFQIGFDWPREKCEYLLKEVGINLKQRPKDVTIDEYLELYRLWLAMR